MNAALATLTVALDISSTRPTSPVEQNAAGGVRRPRRTTADSTLRFRTALMGADTADLAGVRSSHRS